MPLSAKRQSIISQKWVKVSNISNIIRIPSSGFYIQNSEFRILNSESSSLSPVHASRARRTSYMGCIQFIICHSRNPFPWSRPQPGPTHYEWLRNLHCSLGLAHQATTRLSCAVFSDEDSFEQRKQGIRRTITKQKRDCSSRRLCETLVVFLGA